MFTKEFKLAAVKRMEQGALVSIAIATKRNGPRTPLLRQFLG